MSQPENNGAARNPLPPTILPDGSELFRVSEDDPDTVVRRWPNCGPSLSAAPPKTNEVRETLSEEVLALMNAMTAYKRQRGLEYLLWHDVLDVLHDMGYRKVAPPAEVPAPTGETTNT